MTRFPGALIALGLVASVAACARPGNTPTSTPTDTVTMHASAVNIPPSAPILRPSRIAVAGGQAVSHCGAKPIVPPQRIVTPRPTASLSDAEQRAEIALRANNPPTRQRTPVPARALPAAEACVQLLRMELTLLAASGDLTPQRLRDQLAVKGLKAAVRPDLSFTGMVGAACVYGTLPGGKPSFELGPRNADGSCPG